MVQIAVLPVILRNFPPVVQIFKHFFNAKNLFFRAAARLSRHFARIAPRLPFLFAFSC